MNSIKNGLRKILPEDFILWTHKARAIIASFIYGFPARKIKVIGVTGTNGKTTTCFMIAKILEEAGYKVGLATTIRFKIGSQIWPNVTRMTTISPFLLQRMLARMARENCHFAVLETTSHAIKQYRIWGISYQVVAITNVTHEHLDYHKTMEEYRHTKFKLLQSAKTAILNKDDSSYRVFSEMLTNKQISYAIDEKADISARKILYESTGTLFTAVLPEGQIAINLQIPGKFNLYNALAAIGAVNALGAVNLANIKKALEDFSTVPGRMEKIEPFDSAQGRQNFTTIIDYAHTPDAFEQIYSTLRPAVKGKIIHVFGACGDRDRSKRPIMGSQAGRWADYVILTDEDPYRENPAAIIEEIARGVPRGVNPKKPKKLGKNFFKILKRGEAIAKALSLAKKDDLVLITGKGAETSMVIGDPSTGSGLRKIPWSDKKIVKELLAKLTKK